MTKQALLQLITACLVALAISACGSDSDAESNQGLPQGSEPSNIDPADFTTDIDNPYWPMQPGNEWVYSETDTTGAKERVVVTVTNKTKKVANGVTARVITDVVTENGKPVEITDDWYAQDKDGNVWYLGEAVRNFENGKFVDQRRLLRGRCRRCGCGHRDARRPRTRARVPPGVLQGRSRGPGRGRDCRRGPGRGPGRLLQGRADDARPRAAGAEGRGAQVLCAQRRPGAEHPHGRSAAAVPRSCDFTEGAGG